MQSLDCMVSLNFATAATPSYIPTRNAHRLSIARDRGPQDCQALGPHPPCHLGSHEAHPPSHLDPQLPAVPTAPCCTHLLWTDSVIHVSAPTLRLAGFWEGLPSLPPGSACQMLLAPSWLTGNRPLSSTPPLSLEESEEPRWPHPSH